MSVSFCRRVAGLFLVGLLFFVLANQADAVILLFKDGFTIRGRVTQAIELIVDPVSGQAILIPKGGEPFKINDNVRKIIFTPDDVIDVIREPLHSEAGMQIKVAPPHGMKPVQPGWTIEDPGSWDEIWHRKMALGTPDGRSFKMEQRITLLSPHAIRVDAIYYLWYCWYKTSEFDPETVRDLLHSYYARKKKETEVNRRVQTARFLLAADWPEWAKKELTGLKKEDAAKVTVTGLLAEIDGKLALNQADAVLAANKAGQYQTALERAQRFFKEGKEKLIADKLVVQLQDLKSKLEGEGLRLQEAQRLLRALPERVAGARKEPLAKAVGVILDELNTDTLPRLETFLEQARTWELAVKQNRAPPRSAEDVLAYALSGWLQGSEAAGDKADAALALWQGRELILKYLRTDDEQERKKLLKGKATGELRPDVAARMVKYLPPLEPSPVMGTKTTKMIGRLPDEPKGTPYFLKLPPEYRPGRNYPVLVVLHRAADTPKQMLNKWADLAARYGFILVAPDWIKALGNTAYQYNVAEHATVLGCLWDLQRRFQVDSDRIFLFGAEEGGLMAYDVGFSHPSLFAGVAVMSAYPYRFAASYTTNGMYLPLYVACGDKDKQAHTFNEAFAYRSVKMHYPMVLAEYRGRTREWFASEPPVIMDWMSRKKRVFPLQQLGRDDKNDPFRTMRESDNRFYWLSTDAILPNHLNDATAWNPGTRPATLLARISGGNYIYLRTVGLKQATIWLAPGMINFDQKIKLTINGSPQRDRKLRPSLGTLLEDLYQRGDRQRVFVARIDLKL
jgi:pimeloyl-ACP methyl ester carboxylesterase